MVQETAVCLCHHSTYGVQVNVWCVIQRTRTGRPLIGQLCICLFITQFKKYLCNPEILTTFFMVQGDFRCTMSLDTYFFLLFFNRWAYFKQALFLLFIYKFYLYLKSKYFLCYREHLEMLVMLNKVHFVMNLFLKIEVHFLVCK